jgi:hypothetical protein
MTMLTATELRGIIEKITYKPGWNFSLRDEPSDLHYYYTQSVFTITFSVPDAYGFSNMVTIVSQVMFSLEMFQDAERFVDWVMYQILDCEKHEMREFFRYDGVLVSDPHKKALSWLVNHVNQIARVNAILVVVCRVSLVVSVDAIKKIKQNAR